MAILTMRFPVTLGIVACVLLSGCTQPPIDQANLCEVNDWRHDAVAEACTPGQKVVYLPRSWGNEQLPVIFSAVNCDLRYSVALTNGAVTCIYGPITPKPAKPAEQTLAAPAKSG